MSVMKQEIEKSVDIDETFSDEICALRLQREKELRDNSEAIALFEHGDWWFAFEQDADAIYEKTGWQTSAKLMDEGAISWMTVDYNGLAALYDMGVKVQLLKPQTEVEIVDWASWEDYKANRLALAQQAIDYLRLDNRNKEAVVNVGTFPVYSKEDDIQTLVQVNFICFEHQDVSLITDNGQSINLVNGQSWNVAKGMDYIIGAGNILDARHAEVADELKRYGSIEMQQQLKTQDLLEEYSRAVSQYRYDHVVMEQDGFYETFADDAVSMAKKYQLPLWDRDAGNGQVVPVVMLNMEQIDRILSISDDVLIEESNIKESREELVLKPSPLNEGLHSQLQFNESGIKKTRSGDYVVWARMSGVDLPEKEISLDMGVRYSRLSGGAEKEAVLRTVLQQNYGSVLSELSERSQTNTVRMRPTG